MYTKDTKDALDSISVAEGSFVWRPWTGQPEPEISLKAVYLNKKTGSTFGSCSVTNTLLSPETVSALVKFVKLAEGDFAKAVFTRSKEDSSDYPESQSVYEPGPLKGLGE